jgi:hypothetical protein
VDVIWEEMGLVVDTLKVKKLLPDQLRRWHDGSKSRGKGLLYYLFCD